MDYYFLRLNSPRPSFPADMTTDEAGLMREHVAYWKEHMNRGAVVAFGPVADPAGTYGITIIRLEEGEDPLVLAANDPVILADAGFGYQVHPMPRLMSPQGA